MEDVKVQNKVKGETMETFLEVDLLVTKNYIEPTMYIFKYS